MPGGESGRFHQQNTANRRRPMKPFWGKTDSKSHIVALVLLALVALFGVVGCASTTYYHPYKGSDSFERDKRECMMQAEERAANWGAHGNPFMIKDFMQECLEARGWEPQSG